MEEKIHTLVVSNNTQTMAPVQCEMYKVPVFVHKCNRPKHYIFHTSPKEQTHYFLPAFLQAIFPRKFQEPILMFLRRSQMTPTAPTRGLGLAQSKIPLSSARCGRWEPSMTWKRRDRRGKTVTATTTAGLWARRLPPRQRNDPSGGFLLWCQTFLCNNIGRRPEVVLEWL